MGRMQACCYYRVHESQATGLRKGVGEESGDGRLDFVKHRRLQHAVLDPHLDRLTSTSTVKRVNKWYGDLADHGATKLTYNLVPAEWGITAPRDRTEMAGIAVKRGLQRLASFHWIQNVEQH